MWPVIFSIRGFQFTWWLAYLAIALMWSSFVIWRRLKIDYTNEEIFTFNIYLFFMIFAGAFAVGWLEGGKLGGMSGWGMGLSGLSALWQWCKRKQWDFWEMADFFAILAVWLWFIGGLAWGPAAKPMVIFAVFGILILSWIKNNYKKFKWYQSGKVGVTGLFTIIYFCMVQISIALVTPTKVYWGGLTASQWASAWILAFTIVGVYLRSGRKIKEEGWWLFKKNI